MLLFAALISTPGTDNVFLSVSRMFGMPAGFRSEIQIPYWPA